MRVCGSVLLRAYMCVCVRALMNVCMCVCVCECVKLDVIKQGLVYRVGEYY